MDRMRTGAARAAGTRQLNQSTGHAARPTKSEAGMLAHTEDTATATARADPEAGSVLIALAHSSTTKVTPSSTAAAGTAPWSASAHRAPLCGTPPACASTTLKKM
ncbi:hypothetical protein [Streptomyces sp. NPDC048737]|uniref:hypothetical protein n=1 Tax=unclassified Streptomyces TaxID=2593676 RepID=UPI00341370B2